MTPDLRKSFQNSIAVILVKKLESLQPSYQKLPFCYIRKRACQKQGSPKESSVLLFFGESSYLYYHLLKKSFPHGVLGQALFCKNAFYYDNYERFLRNKDLIFILITEGIKNRLYFIVKYTSLRY